MKETIPDLNTEPLWGADPFVAYDEESGKYFYVKSINEDTQLSIWTSERLETLGRGESKVIFSSDQGNKFSWIWAPELHKINGKWYIPFTASIGRGESLDTVNETHRVYFLEADKPAGKWELKGKLDVPEADYWAIDFTYLRYNGRLYGVWSGWVDQEYRSEQRLYIAPMANPWTVGGPRVEISRPEYPWETSKGMINEGPQAVISPDGRVSIIFAANASWTRDYCQGVIVLTEMGDPLNPEDWEKHPFPLISGNGIGHGHVFLDPVSGNHIYAHHIMVGDDKPAGWDIRAVQYGTAIFGVSPVLQLIRNNK